MIIHLLIFLMAVVGAITLVVYGCLVLASRGDEEMNLSGQKLAPQKLRGAYFIRPKK
jgi:hypothetical protein